VIVVNWNGARFLERCLAALCNQTFSDFEIIVVDNRSTDGSADDLESKFKARALHVERLPMNRGFPAANNLGARLARGKWLALLNNDAFPAPDWLECLVGVAESQPDYAFFASRLIQAENRERLDGAGDMYHISGMSWRRFYNAPTTRACAGVEEVFGACAAAALYRRDAFLAVDGFDEDWFAYHEDTDLGFRLRLRGLRCLYVPQAVVYHIGSATNVARSDFAVYYGHRNLVLTFVKNMPTELLWRYLPAHLMANLLMLTYYSVNGHASAIWRAKIDALRRLPAVWRKRREVQRTRRVAASEIARVLDHGWLSPYLRKG